MDELDDDDDDERFYEKETIIIIIIIGLNEWRMIQLWSYLTFFFSLYFLSSLVDFIHQVSSLSSVFFEWMKDDEDDDDDEDHCSTSSSMIMVRRITLLRFTSQIFFSSSSIIINRQKILDFFHFKNKRRIFLEFFLWPFFQNSIIRNSCWNPKDSIRRRFKFPLELTWLKKMIR